MGGVKDTSINSFDRDVERQRRKGQVVIREPGDNGDARAENMKIRRNEMRVSKERQHHAVIGEDELPNDCSNNEGDEKGHQQHDEKEVLSTTAVEGNPISDGERNDEV